MDQKPFLRLSPERKMTMTLALRQALDMLQMPQLELSQWLEQEIEKNPLLEVSLSGGKRGFVEELPAPVNLHEHLLSQIREHFSSEQELKVAQVFLECLDEKGFISTAPEKFDDTFVEHAANVLAVLQTFSPAGIFARTLQESFLLQLKAKGKVGTEAFLIVEQCFEDLLHSRYRTIKKKLGIKDLSFPLKELGLLSMRPACAFSQEPSVSILADLRLVKVDNGWILELVDDELPKIRLKEEYLGLEVESKEEKEALRGFKTQAKWIVRSLERRRKMLLQIGKEIVSKQSRYLNHKGKFSVLTIKELSKKLDIHESTLSRALNGKYISTPRGIISLRSLISVDAETKNARDVLKKLIKQENRAYPLTDEQLSVELKKQGFLIARRTIAKYRTQLKIGSASRRKHSL